MSSQMVDERGYAESWVLAAMDQILAGSLGEGSFNVAQIPQSFVPRTGNDIVAVKNNANDGVFMAGEGGEKFAVVNVPELGTCVIFCNKSIRILP